MLRGPSQVSFVHCQGFLRNLSMSLHTNRWHMAYFLCNFQGFPLLGAASAKLLKKLQFPCFSHAGKPYSYDFIALRGPSPVSFVHCQGFMRNLSMSLHTNRWHMAYFLFSFQSFPLLWAASAKLLKKLQFPSFQWVSLPISSFSFALGRSIRENC